MAGLGARWQAVEWKEAGLGNFFIVFSAGGELVREEDDVVIVFPIHEI